MPPKTQASLRDFLLDLWKPIVHSPFFIYNSVFGDICKVICFMILFMILLELSYCYAVNVIVALNKQVLLQQWGEGVALNSGTVVEKQKTQKPKREKILLKSMC